MKPSNLFAILAAATAALSSLAFAEPGSTPASPDVVAKLKSLYPNTGFNAINATAMPGITEVVMGENVAYVDATGRYFLFGHLYDMQAGRDLTAEKAELGSRIDFSALPLKDAIVNVQGTGRRKLAVFSDPDCPFCKRLAPDLATLKDVTIYTFLMPLEELHPDARNKALAVWCAKDRSAVWLGLMERGVLPKSHGKCESNPLQRNAELAKRLGVNGTPALFAEDGRRLAGAASASRLEAFLAAPVVAAQGTQP
jgi:thiol:disulfide interchange protein DsbC